MSLLFLTLELKRFLYNMLSLYSRSCYSLTLSLRLEPVCVSKKLETLGSVKELHLCGCCEQESVHPYILCSWAVLPKAWLRICQASLLQSGKLWEFLGQNLGKLHHLSLQMLYITSTLKIHISIFSKSVLHGEGMYCCFSMPFLVRSPPKMQNCV